MYTPPVVIEDTVIKPRVPVFQYHPEGSAASRFADETVASNMNCDDPDEKMIDASIVAKNNSKQHATLITSVLNGSASFLSTAEKSMSKKQLSDEGSSHTKQHNVNSRKGT